MMTANIIDSVWQHDNGVSVEDDRKINSPDPAHRLVLALGSIVVAARDLSEDDHARVKRFILAAGDLMSSRDRLKSPDRQMFETALRDAIARTQGY